MNFSAAEKIAAAVLYEGYILYPYRKTAIKNPQRWNFGTLYPRVYAERQREAFSLTAELLVVGQDECRLELRISFLQLVRQQGVSDGRGDLDGAEFFGLSDPSLAWDEAVERTSEHATLELRNLIAVPRLVDLHFEGGVLPEGRSTTAAPDLDAALGITSERLPERCCKLHIELQNASPLAVRSKGGA